MATKLLNFRITVACSVITTTRTSPAVVQYYWNSVFYNYFLLLES